MLNKRRNWAAFIRHEMLIV